MIHSQNSTSWSISRFLSVCGAAPELISAQYRAFTRQVPLSYLTLILNTWIVAANFMALAPRALTVYVPGLLTAIFGIRLIVWWRSARCIPPARQAARLLDRTSYLAVVITVAISAWTFCLSRYGDTDARALLAFYLALTFIGCVICLMHLRPAAILTAATGTLGFVAAFGMLGGAFISMSAIAVIGVGAGLAMLQVNYRDFTQLVAAQVRTQSLSNENLRLANLDALTSLPNRRHFFRHLEEMFELSKLNGRTVAVGVLDLDGFKPVNDIFGHAVGDELLRAVGERLSATWESRAHIARLGGDEFALVVMGMRGDELLRMGEKTCAAISRPYFIGGATVRVTASIGFAVFPDLADRVGTLFERADFALARGKRSGRGKAWLFSLEQMAEMRCETDVERALNTADLEKEISLEFQPIYEVETHQIVGMEALARWTSPLLGRVSPAMFIQVAERSSLITRLTQVVMRKALSTAVSWPVGIRLAVNLSAADLCSPEALATVAKIITASGFDPLRLDIEITETTVLSDLVQTTASIRQLKALGCGISLDDFGTGFSSFSRLHMLPLTKIKIDRSFVSDIHVRPTSFNIVKSLVALSRDMGLECIVEGVEKEWELSSLRTLGCRVVQGFLFSRPLTEAAAFEILSTQARYLEAEADTSAPGGGRARQLGSQAFAGEDASHELRPVHLRVAATPSLTVL
jgi:diguanylate cyclase (GGDEF)-like protein